ncbi:Endonuclease/exonuclease/phosphatase [Annulohypoxylon moriforme]|nr:Endonuclease/exonuclease/phosphatase [Annulohypoxylon moriforme]
MNQSSRRNINPEHPNPQPYYTYDNSKQSWVQADSSSSSEVDNDKRILRLSLFSWNIDFRIPYAKERMNAALDHLQGLVEKLPSATASVIFLQECIFQDLRTIGANPWIREKFYFSDISTSNWADDYGTITLVDRRLRITSCFRVHYDKTRMGRDAFFVDILLSGGNDQDRTVMAEYMRQDGVNGALAAGDFNAIQAFDRTLHSENGLKDAYLEFGGEEDSEEGYTWGQQASTEERDMFGLSRMDKIYFTGSLKLHKFEKFGVDVQLDEEELELECEHLVSYGYEKPWITDHLGVMAEVEVID